MQTRSPQACRAAPSFHLLALHSDLLQLVILELPSGSDVKALSRTCHALHALVVNGGLELASAWLWRQHGNQALLKAQEQQDVAMLRRLVEVYHADVNCISVDGLGCLTILHWACCCGQLEVVRYLLSVPGLQVNKGNDVGDTALHAACSGGHESLILELLKHPSINVNEVDQWGNTALHRAAWFKQGAAVRVLLSHPGINVHVKDKSGAAALAIAKWCGGSAMVASLTAHIEATSRLCPAGR